MSNSLSRRSFLKGVAASALGAAAWSSLAPLSAFADGAGVFRPGAYKSVQSTPYGAIEVTCTFSADKLTDVSYGVLRSSRADYFIPFTAPLQAYCSRIVEAGSPVGVDGVSGATFCSDAIDEGVKACMIQALGLELPKAQAVLNPQEEGFDTFDSDLAAVFSPLQLGSMTIRNRTAKSAGTGTWFDQTGDSVPISAEVYGRMAANEVGLIILPGYDLVPGFGPDDPEVDEEQAIRAMMPVTQAVHSGGGKIGYQMCFGGGAPTVPDEVINDTPVEELQAFIERCGIAAARAREAGFDCIEIKGASADGLNGFLTRRVNRREDEYGPQSIENRTRLFRQMIRKIKEVNGADYPVGALINGVEENDVVLGQNDKFLTIEETKAIAHALEEAGADWIQVRVGANGQELNIWALDVQHTVKDADGNTGNGSMFDYSRHYEGLVDGSHSGFGSFLPIVKAMKEAVKIPVGCACYMDLRVGPDYLNAAIERGELDLIFMNRPLNCDWELVRKMHEGRREDVIPCMHCQHCHDGLFNGWTIPDLCRMNPVFFNALTDVMPEGFDLIPASENRRVMVIGAGPAGLEAARVAAERGFEVSLYDASDRIGGLMHFAKGVKGDHERYEDFFTYMEHQLEKNGVSVQLFKRVDAAFVREQNPDVVIVAVGGLREEKMASSGALPVFTPEEAFGTSALGSSVVILGAGAQAADFAAYLATQGKKVALVHGGTEADIDKEQSGEFQIYLKGYLQGKGTRFWNQAELLSIDNDSVRIRTELGLETVIPCDSVVDFRDMIPNTALAEELRAAGFEVYEAGDCVEPKNIRAAIFKGHMISRYL